MFHNIVTYEIQTIVFERNNLITFQAYAVKKVSSAFFFPMYVLLYNHTISVKICSCELISQARKEKLYIGIHCNRDNTKYH